MINLNVYKTNIGWIYSFAQSSWMDSSKILINDKASVIKFFKGSKE